MIGKEINHILVKHNSYSIRVNPCSLQLITNNNVDIPEPFEKNKNPDESNKHIDSKLV